MSIKLLARELYVCQAKVHKLEEELRTCSQKDADGIKEQLRKARNELRQIDRILQGQKEAGRKTPHRFA